MKRITIILLTVFLPFITSAHKEWVHQYLTQQGYLFLQYQIGDIPSLRDAIGLDYHGTGDATNPWLSNYPLGVGTWREDIDDPVYGYGLWNGGTASLTHFWKADDGENAGSYIRADIYGLGTKSGTYENAWQKAQIYLFGGKPLRIALNRYIIDINGNLRFAVEEYISYSSLVDLYKTGQYQRNGYINTLGQYVSDGAIKTDLAVARKLAFNILGRVAHLLQDMSVPAHAHVHAHPCPLYYPDYYENYMGFSWPRQGPRGVLFSESCEDDPASYGFSTNDYPAVKWNYLTAAQQGGMVDNIPCRNSRELLMYLFYTTNQLADYFPSGTTTLAQVQAGATEGYSSDAKQTFMLGNAQLP